MKAVCATFLSAVAVARSGQLGANPLGKVLDLLGELEAKIIKEGETEAKAFKEYFEYCDDTSKNGQFSIETAEKEVAVLEAKIGQLTGTAAAAGDKIEDLAGTIAETEAQLKDAAQIRKREASEFSSSEAELVESLDTLDRAIGVLEREAAKNPAALAQVSSSANVPGMINALEAVLDAAAFPGSDQRRLAALVQAKSQAEDEDAEVGAPAAAVYKSKSGGIVDVLEDMREKAEGQLADLRKAEVNGKHNFEMLAQSLRDQLSADNKDMGEEKAAKAASEEGRASSEGDLTVAKKNLVDSQEQLTTAKSSCMTVAADHEATVASRGEELKALAQAKQALKGTSSGAVSQTYSLLQLSSRVDLKNREVVAMVKHLAASHHSTALAQLASRIAAVAKFGSASGDDVFGKIKGMISAMISKLEDEMTAETEEKAYCDEQMSKTQEKKADLEAAVQKLTTKIDLASAQSTKLKEQVQELENELAALAKEQAEMDKIRHETHADYETAIADLELGLSGVRKALQVLREYYGEGITTALVQDDVKFESLMQQPAMPEHHEKAAGAGGSIVGMLEVVESDFGSNLAKEETQESDAQSEYEKMTQDNKVTKASKSQDVKYKEKEAKSLEKTISELSGDRDSSSNELAAVSEYYGQIRSRCVAKPENYEQRKARRDAEIKGLKEALVVLQDETAFVQRKRRSFRGAVLSAK